MPPSTRRDPDKYGGSSRDISVEVPHRSSLSVIFSMYLVLR